MSRKLKSLRQNTSTDVAEYADEAVKVAMTELGHATNVEVKNLKKEISDLKKAVADLAAVITDLRSETTNADPRYVLTKRNLVDLWRRLEEEGHI